MKIFLSILVVCAFASCYYDSQEYLYPQIDNACDTSKYSFQADIQPILSNECYQCHSNSNYQSGGGIKLENYADVKSSAESGQLIGTITHTSPYPSMPPGGSLDNCSITKIEKWKTNLYPNK